MSNSADRLTHFDGLRGIAACMVLFSHLLCALYPSAISGLASESHTAANIETIIGNTPLNLLFNGEFAVCIFFAISGYVLSYHYFLKPDKKKVIANAIKRYPRLMILVWLSVLLSFIIYKLNGYCTAEAALITQSDWLNKLFSVDQSFIQLLKNIGYEQFLKHNTPTPLNPVLWTIATELKGSFLVFFILFIIPKSTWRYVIYAFFFVYYFKGYFMLFVAGIALADISTTRVRHLNLSAWTWIVLFLVCVLSGSYRQGIDFMGWQWIRPLEQFTKPNFIGAITLLFMVCYFPGAKFILNKKPAQWLGRVSYSLYLFHLIIICAVTTPFFLLVYTSSGQYHLSALLSIACSIPFILMICRYVFTPVDEWSVRISNKLAARVRQLING